MGALKISYELVKVLKEKFGEEQAEKIASCIEASIDDRFDVIKSTLATKEDIARLDSKIESTSKQTLIWMFGILVALLSLAVAVIKLIH